MPEKPLLFGNDEPNLQKKVDASVGRKLYPTNDLYIPGYTERVMANDMSLAQKLPSGAGMSEETKRQYYKRFGFEPAPLPCHIVSVRVVGGDLGESFNANVQLQVWRDKGYRPLLKKDFEEGGICQRHGIGEPPAATLTPQKTYRRWDSEFWIVDGKRHQENEAIAQAERDAAEESTGMPEVLGYDPSGEPIRGFDLPTETYTKHLNYAPKE